MSEMSLKDALTKLKYRNCAVYEWETQQQPELIAEIRNEFAAGNNGHWVVYRAVKTLIDVPFTVKTFVAHYRGDCRCSKML